MNESRVLHHNEFMKVKLIFNPKAGARRKTRIELPDVINEIVRLDMEPDACVLEPGTDLAEELRSSLAHGICTYIVCGGDGTISTVANILAGTGAKLAIIPCGTQNNDAKSLNIPLDLSGAAALIRTGTLTRIDMGTISCGGKFRYFMEIVSVGLVAALSESGDEIQHGNIGELGSFLSTLISCPPAQISLTLDNKERVRETGYIVMVTNMPYAGSHYQFADENCHQDGLLNVLFFPELSKIDLVKYISGGIYPGKPEDPRIRHYCVQELTIETEPPMPVMVDGSVVGEGKAHIALKRKALEVYSGR